MMGGGCHTKMSSMARVVAGPIFLRSYVGLTLQAAPRALQLQSLIPMLQLVEDGGIGLFLIFEQRSLSYLQARATRNQRPPAFNAGMIMGSLATGDPVLRLDQP